MPAVTALSAATSQRSAARLSYDASSQLRDFARYAAASALLTGCWLLPRGAAGLHQFPEIGACQGQGRRPGPPYSGNRRERAYRQLGLYPGQRAQQAPRRAGYQGLKRADKVHPFTIPNADGSFADMTGGRLPFGVLLSRTAGAVRLLAPPATTTLGARPIHWILTMSAKPLGAYTNNVTRPS
jgi:hypothetical protein